MLAFSTKQPPEITVSPLLSSWGSQQADLLLLHIGILNLGIGDRKPPTLAGCQATAIRPANVANLEDFNLVAWGQHEFRGPLSRESIDGLDAYRSWSWPLGSRS